MPTTRYTPDHTWVRMEDDVAVIGISEAGQERLGDVVAIEAPEVGRDVEAGEACAVVEAEEDAIDLPAPVAGRVVEVNQVVLEEPALLNRDPEGEGWVFKLEPSDPEAVEALMDESDYLAFLEDEDG